MSCLPRKEILWPCLDNFFDGWLWSINVFWHYIQFLPSICARVLCVKLAYKLRKSLYEPTKWRILVIQLFLEKEAPKKIEIVKWSLILHKYCILLTILIFTGDLCTGSMCKIRLKTANIVEKKWKFRFSTVRGDSESSWCVKS